MTNVIPYSTSEPTLTSAALDLLWSSMGSGKAHRPIMPSFFAPSRLALACCLAALTACGPSPEPAAPPALAAPAATSSASAAPSTSASAAPSQKAAAGVDYGTPPTRCIQRSRLPRPSGLGTAERSAKRFEVAGKALEAGALFIELDARKPGVVVPPGYQIGRLVLSVGYAMPQPIPDLVVNAEGVTGQLLFKGHRFAVRLPWEAVYGFQSPTGDLWRWAEDVPPDVICPEEEEEPIDDLE